jgi:hypothetical protein
MAPTPNGDGYWLLGADGGIFTFGDASFRGSAVGGMPAGEAAVAVAEGTGVAGTPSPTGDFVAPPSTTAAVEPGNPYGAAASGYDISWPQCGGAYPPSAPVAVVGVNDGTAFSANPCFDSEATWAGGALSVYVNLNAPQGSDPAEWDQGPAGSCSVGDLPCESYNYGYNTVADSIAAAAFDGHPSHAWWLDVETANYWTSDTEANAQVIAGALRAVADAHDQAAIYSTSSQWEEIAGSYVPGTPVWYPTGTVAASYTPWCTGSSFAGGPVYLVQHGAGSFDGDYSC